MNAGRNIRQRLLLHACSPTRNKDTVYALNTSAFRSADGGKTLTQIASTTAITTISGSILTTRSTSCSGTTVAAPSPSTSPRRSSWSGQGFLTEAHHVITTKHAPFHVAARSRTTARLIPSNNGIRGRGDGGGGTGRDTQAFYDAGGGEPGHIAPDPKDVDVIYAGTNNGGFLTRLNRRTGELRGRPASALLLRRASSAVVERW